MKTTSFVSTSYAKKRTSPLITVLRSPEDVEWLRNTIGAERWVLIGVSYGSIYAQAVVKEYPDRVEAMILDSAAFPNLHRHHNFLADTMAPYLALLNYCNADPACDEPIEGAERTALEPGRGVGQKSDPRPGHPSLPRHPDKSAVEWVIGW